MKGCWTLKAEIVADRAGSVDTDRAVLAASTWAISAQGMSAS